MKKKSWQLCTTIYTLHMEWSSHLDRDRYICTDIELVKLGMTHFVSETMTKRVISDTYLTFR